MTPGLMFFSLYFCKIIRKKKRKEWKREQGLREKEKFEWENNGITHTDWYSLHVLEPYVGISPSKINFISQRPKVHYRMDPCQPLWYVVQIFSCRVYSKKEIHINWLNPAFQLVSWFLSTFHLNLVSYKQECLSLFPFHLPHFIFLSFLKQWHHVLYSEC